MRIRTWKAVLAAVPLLLLGVVAIVASPVGPAAPAAAAEGPNCPPPGRLPEGGVRVPFERLWNGTDHFHTTSAAEVAAASSAGYGSEGVKAFVSAVPTPDLVPFFRLYNPKTGDHFHTVSAAEAFSAKSTGGYFDEGIGGYVFPPGSGKGIPFFRLYNPKIGDHFHTTDVAEVAKAAKDGYDFEGVGAEVLA